MKRLLNISPLWVPAILAAVMFTDTAISAGQPIVERTDREMCEEVAHELNDWYTSGDGTITKEEAHRIIDRCFRMFVDTK